MPAQQVTESGINTQNNEAEVAATSGTDAPTFQSGIKQHTTDLSKYALFLGGLNVTSESLKQYDPLRTGYGRLFMVRSPLFVENAIPNKLAKFKHILEYGAMNIRGNTDMSMDFQSLSGGYANRQFEFPTYLQDQMNEFTVSVPEFSGSPVREVIMFWLTGIGDPQTGYATYHVGTNTAAGNQDLPRISANQTAEFVYVATDNTGRNVEYAAFLANCTPKTVPLQHFDYESGSHNAVTLDLNFTCVRYVSEQINKLGYELIKKYNVLMDSMNFNSGFVVPSDRQGTYYNIHTGEIRGKNDTQEGTMAPSYIAENDSTWNVNN